MRRTMIIYLDIYVRAVLNWSIKNFGFKTEMGLRAFLVHVRMIFKLKVLFPYFTCNFGRVGPSFDHDGTAI